MIAKKLGQGGAFQQIGTKARGTEQRLFATPGGDLPMIAAQKHGRHVHAAIARRTRVLRIFEQPVVAEALVDGAHVVAENAGNETHDGVDDDHGGELPRGEHVIAEGNAFVCQCVGAFVYALVMPADEHQPILRREALRDLLRERHTRRRKEYDMGLRALRGDGIVGFEDGRACHKKALAAPIRIVVGRAMAVVRPVAQVVSMEFEQAEFLRPLHDGILHDGIVHAGKRRDGVDAHARFPLCFGCEFDEPVGKRDMDGPRDVVYRRYHLLDGRNENIARSPLDDEHVACRHLGYFGKAPDAA